MADGGGGDIIIKGGSVKVSFDTGLYIKDETVDPTCHKHETRKITRVLVADEGEKTRYDSGASDGGLGWTVTVFTSEK